MVVRLFAWCWNTQGVRSVWQEDEFKIDCLGLRFMWFIVENWTRTLEGLLCSWKRKRRLHACNVSNIGICIYIYIYISHELLIYRLMQTHLRTYLCDTTYVCILLCLCSYVSAAGTTANTTTTTRSRSILVFIIYFYLCRHCEQIFVTVKCSSKAFWALLKLVQCTFSMDRDDHHSFGTLDTDGFRIYLFVWSRSRCSKYLFEFETIVFGVKCVAIDGKLDFIFRYCMEN